MSSHTLSDDFQHFLSYSNYSGLSEEEIARLRKAYEHGASRGESTRLANEVARLTLELRLERMERDRDRLIAEPKTECIHEIGVCMRSVT